jgi:hypothetical protein
LFQHLNFLEIPLIILYQILKDGTVKFHFLGKTGLDFNKVGLRKLQENLGKHCHTSIRDDEAFLSYDVPDIQRHKLSVLKALA